ncbi:RBBP9/YdeN family alpha/beta hydrolase [Sinorhizobium numidicum]|uniref:RBBP9/YdeN family alpha/beta hydrolase n=1 Tax=Sinorhizobium numidicum TaxID=680248 RepID=UPI003CC891DC
MKSLVRDTETLILPGLNGSPEGHWQRHWARDRSDSRVVEQDNWPCPDLHSWLERLVSAIEASPGDVKLVAHSLGCGSQQTLRTTASHPVFAGRFWSRHVTSPRPRSCIQA